MLRRYSPLKPSRGTQIPDDVRKAVIARDGNQCVPQLVGIAHVCSPGRELDHVRASGALGKKSRTTVDNLVTTCPAGHRAKTEHGKEARPLLLDWIARRSGECTHVDPVFGCSSCARRTDPLTVGLG